MSDYPQRVGLMRSGNYSFKPWTRFRGEIGEFSVCPRLVFTLTTPFMDLTSKHMILYEETLGVILCSSLFSTRLLYTRRSRLFISI